MRLIDADAIPYFGEVYGHDRVTFKARIDTLPTIDAEPVVHGHWKKSGNYVCGEYEFVCSVCGDCRWEGWGFPERSHFCQNCGAKMDEEDNI